MINNSLGSFSCILWMSFILILMFAGCNTNYSWNSNTPRINVASICTFSYDRKLSYNRTCFGGTYTKIGTIQRRLAWPPGRKDDTQIREAFHVFFSADAADFYCRKTYFSWRLFCTGKPPTRKQVTAYSVVPQSYYTVYHKKGTAYICS